MKMPRSHCESDNVQFVQELAEVDGPFESPIDINFKDLAKLELPCLVWNRSNVPPKKMKITNTGHTVIISGKWKCERPYLTGGPLLGKYVFSQIHFHWGQDELKGSEHQICGEGFPLEMHVAHFKAEYATQENALREKDGMVVVVYLFKIQDEPNACLKSIISLLPCVHQPSTSQHIDPRPILSLCNPFTDDYFMYWGSVVTSTCAHILLWIVSREPFGISRDQVNEFRKILDSSQKPIQRNSRELQPLHKRNVFHVNASKNLDQPLLPIKKIMKCFCRGSEDNVCDTECGCRPYRNQEEIQGSNFKSLNSSQGRDYRGRIGVDWTGLPKDFRVQQTTFVHSATIQISPRLFKKFESDQAANMYYTESVQIQNPEENSKIKLVSHSCCFVPAKEISKSKKRLEKRKNRDRKKNFDSVKAFGHILNSLETIKNHTFKKLKEIESINEEIKGIKSFCSDIEDKKWVRNVEKIMSRQKRFTIKTSKECINEIKNLAKECNFDKLFDKNFPVGDNNFKMLWENVTEVGDQVQVGSNEDIRNVKDIVLLEKLPWSRLSVNKAIKFSNKAQKLLESFFEDIKESEDLQQSVQKDLQLKKINSLFKKQAGDSISVEKLFNEGFITQKLFNLGNLEDRFFTEVTAEMEKDNLIVRNEGVINYIPTEENMIKMEASEKIISLENTAVEGSTNTLSQVKNEEIIPLRRANIAVLLSHEPQPELEKNSNIFPSFEKDSIPHLKVVSGTEASSEGEVIKHLITKCKMQPQTQVLSNCDDKKEKSLTTGSLLKELVSNNLFKNLKYSTSSTSTTESSETHRMIFGKIHKKLNKQTVWERKSSAISKGSLKGFSNHKKQKFKNVNFEYLYLKNKKSKNKRKKICKAKKSKKEVTFSKTSSTTSKEAIKHFRRKPNWKKLTKSKLDLGIKKSNREVVLECSVLTPERKKLKLNYQKSRKKRQQSKPKFFSSSDSECDAECKKYLKKQMKKETNFEDLFKLKKKDSFEIIPYKSNEYSEKLVHQQNINTQAVKEILLEQQYEESKNLEISKQEDYLPFKPIQIESLKAKSTPPVQPKLTFKNKSLTNLTNKYKYESSQRVFVENLEKRQKCARESFKFFKKIKNTKASEEAIIVKSLNQGTSNKILELKNSDKGQKEIDSEEENDKVPDLQSAKVIEYKVGLFTTASVIDKELTPKTQKLDIQRYIGITKIKDKKLEVVNKQAEEIQTADEELSKEESKESSKTEIKISLSNTKEASNDGTQTSEVIPEVEKLNEIRQLSGESLNLSGKSLKGKIKKRPHYCKRNLKYHLKKSSIFKKNNKTESKSPPLLLLTEEEQLKIISENVVKYLKSQLSASKSNFDIEKNISCQKLEEEFLENCKKTEKSLNNNSTPEKTTHSKIQRYLHSRNIQRPEKIKSIEISDKQKGKGIEFKIPPQSVKKNAPNPQKPANNFIKLNKLMAGKYKRMRPVEIQSEKDKFKNTTTNVVKSFPKKRDKSPVCENPDQKPKTNSGNKSIAKPSLIAKPPRQNCMKSQVSVKMEDSNFKKVKKDPLTGKIEAEKKGNLEQIECFSGLQEIAPIKRWVPTYMLTSYLPNPIEIAENKKKKFNRYLVKMQSTNFVRDRLFDPDMERKKNKDSIVSSELEYLLNLQMCLNNEITAKVENSMSKISQDQNGILEKSKKDFLDPCSKGILLIGANKLMNKSNSKTEYLDDLKALDSKEVQNSSLPEQKVKLKEVTNTKTVKESGDSELIISPARDSSDNPDYNSDSSFNCEILITLNSETNENETQLQARDSKNGEFKNVQCVSIQNESETKRQECEYSEQTILLKPQRKKRKENEISTEMKQKLLEILEGEIKREMGLSCRSSLENLDDDVSVKWKKPDCVERSQSLGTSTDNTEVLAEISETMKQYLSNLKQRCLATRRKNKEKKKRKETT